jgi:peptide/nickel transport system permease protein
MGRFLLRRAIESLVALWLASVIVFIGMRALPGDPAIALSGEGRDPAVNTVIRARYALDQPLPVQYVRWASLAISGDLGTSIRTRLPVTAEILRRIPTTLELAALAGLIAILLGLPLGILAAVRRGSPLDYVANIVGLVGLSIPTFWLGLILILVFAIGFAVLPASGFVPLLEDPVENLRRLILPAAVLGSGLGAILLRQTRSAMIASLQSDYVRTARAKGLRERDVVLRHALRNSLVTVVTVLGLELGALISGSVVTESIFLIPGFGRMIIEAISTRDYPLIQGVALVSAVAYIGINLIVDVLYSVLNPKVRIQAAAR